MEFQNVINNSMKNIVFIVNLEESYKQGRNTPYHFAVQAWTKWCQTHNAELVVLTERIYPEDYMNANWHKLFVFQLLEASEIEYNQILIVDADTIPHPNSPNIFEMTDNKFCAVRNFGSMDWVCRSYENYKKHLFPDVTYSPFQYFNSGVLVVNKDHKQLYDDIIEFYKNNSDTILELQRTYGVGTDQPVLNFFIHKDNIQHKLLDYEWNMQDMNRFEILQNDVYINIGWIYHFNSMPIDMRNYLMQKTYNILYNEK